MADQKIELEIVLDDGSVKKAFASVKREAKDTAENVADSFGSFNPIKLLGIEAGLELFDRFASSVKRVSVELINLSLEAEKVRVVNAQFQALTQQNAISTEAFNQAIQRSIAGLIDDEDALQLANNAMIRLGSTASRLPEIFELARKAGASGFGDIANNAEAFTNAIQTGNARQLRALGIVVDLTKAQKDFANSIGLTVDQLTEEQRAFVNANTVIAEATKRFGTADANIRGFSDSLARFKVAAADAFERFAVGFDRAFGPTIKAILDTMTEGLNGNGAALKAQKVNVSDLGNEVTKLEQKLVSLNEKLIYARTDTQFSTINRQINETNELLTELKKRQDALNEPNRGDDLLAQNINKYVEYQNAIKLTDEQKEQAYQRDLQRQQAINQAQATFQQQEIAARQQAMQFEFNDDKRREEMAFLHEENLRMIAENGIIARANIEQQYSDAKGFSQAQRDQLMLEQVQAQNAQVLAAEQAYQAQSASQFDQFLARSQRTFKQLGDAAKITFVSQIGGAFAAFGNALAKGENAMEAFGKAILGILGDIAINMGQSFILQGIAMSLNPLTPGAGGGLIAAGAALAIFGGLLKGLAGGGGGGAATTGGGGGIAAPTEMGTGFNAATPMPDTRIQPNTVVNFTVQGDILDSDSTQNRIVQLLNDAIDSKGAVVRGI